MKLDILMDTRDGKTYIIDALEGAILKRSRNAVSVFEFQMIKSVDFTAELGGIIRAYYSELGTEEDKQEVFFGYIFEVKRNKDNILSVTCFDQMRYLKNKTTYQYRKKGLKEVVQYVAGAFGVKVGEVTDVKSIIERRDEDGQTGLDIIINAMKATSLKENDMYVLYDNFGKLTVKSIKDMEIPYYIDNTQAEDFSYLKSIDKKTYTEVFLIRDSEKESNSASGAKKQEKERETKTANNKDLLKKYGSLVYYETVNNKSENLDDLAKRYLEAYSSPTVDLDISNCFPDMRVFGGSVVYISLNLGDIEVNQKLMVESIIFNFENNLCLADLTLNTTGLRDERNKEEGLGNI